MYKNIIKLHIHESVAQEALNDFNELYNVKHQLENETVNCGGEMVHFVNLNAEWESKYSLKTFMEGIKEFAKDHQIHWPTCKSTKIEEEEKPRVHSWPTMI